MYTDELIDLIKVTAKRAFDRRLKVNKNGSRFWAQRLIERILSLLPFDVNLQRVATIANLALSRIDCCCPDLFQQIYDFCVDRIGDDFQLELFDVEYFLGLEEPIELTEEDKAAVSFNDFWYQNLQFCKYNFLSSLFNWFFHRGFYWRSFTPDPVETYPNSVQLTLWGV
ncbi:hypothetical protein [Spirulina sp. 06S082]|uniref:hypothetical protein n=1 Tax=Spirulina sp. 06S082 TaxID=3110248 RepID=UPI002B206830|nr:hypothetical protein [Spirulina sp. 06S082]MEA5472151.1 hypothetical protein [Spirulina sp. 06S082]